MIYIKNITNRWISLEKDIRFTVKDIGSGIDRYTGYLNGKWILFEYEPKNKNLTYNFNDLKFKSGKQDLKLKVTDNVGNESIFQTTFYRKYD